jgi:hypothetical protein
VKAKLALLLLCAAVCAFSQASKPGLTVTVARIPATYLQQLLPSDLSPSPDTIQVWVKSSDSTPSLVEVVLKYESNNQIITATSMRKMSAGLDVHSFAVPSYSVRIVSVTLSAAPVTQSQEFTSF